MSNKVPPNALADQILLEDNHFAQDTGDKLFIYRQGVYRPGGEEFVRGRVKWILADSNRSDQWSGHLAGEVVEYVRVDCPGLWDRPPDDVINVNNGLLNVNCHALLPHRPDFLSQIRLPVAYDLDADSLGIEWFIRGVFPEDSLDLPYEIAGVGLAASLNAWRNDEVCGLGT